MLEQRSYAELDMAYWAGVAALTKYMMDKGYRLPSDEEMKECSLYVWRKLLHIN